MHLNLSSCVLLSNFVSQYNEQVGKCVTLVVSTFFVLSIRFTIYQVDLFIDRNECIVCCIPRPIVKDWHIPIISWLLIERCAI